MKRIVYKYPLRTGSNIFSAPAGAVPLHVENQGNVPTLWMLCDPCAIPQTRCFTAVLTGCEFDDAGMSYVGTILLQQGSFVVHVFEALL